MSEWGHFTKETQMTTWQKKFLAECRRQHLEQVRGAGPLSAYEALAKEMRWTVKQAVSARIGLKRIIHGGR